MYLMYDIEQWGGTNTNRYCQIIYPFIPLLISSKYLFIISLYDVQYLLNLRLSLFFLNI
jgi:hypothetical protein